MSAATLLVFRFTVSFTASIARDLPRDAQPARATEASA